MEAELTAALIGAVAAVTGSAFFVYAHEWYKERRLRRRIASTLLAELIAQSEFVCALSRAAHATDVPVKETFAKFLPARPSLFDALAHQVPILGARTASLLVASYTSIGWAGSLVENLPTTIQFAQTKRGPNNAPSMAEFRSATVVSDLLQRQSSGVLLRLREACRGAASNTCLTIQALDEIADYKRLRNDETIIADVIRKLQLAATADETNDNPPNQTDSISGVSKIGA